MGVKRWAARIYGLCPPIPAFPRTGGKGEKLPPLPGHAEKGMLRAIRGDQTEAIMVEPQLWEGV